MSMGLRFKKTAVTEVAVVHRSCVHHVAVSGFYVVAKLWTFFYGMSVIMRVGSEFDSISGAARPCAVAVADGQQHTFACDCVSYRAFGVAFSVCKKAFEIAEHD